LADYYHADVRVTNDYGSVVVVPRIQTHHNSAHSTPQTSEDTHHGY